MPSCASASPASRFISASEARSSSSLAGSATGRRNFARIRREKGLTQEQMEERSGFSQQYISGLEQGRRNPTVVTLYELAEALARRISVGDAVG